MSGDYGIKITLPGKDVSSTDLRDYVLHSGYNILKTYIVGTASFYLASEAEAETNHNIITINHNLGYKPLAVMFWSTGGNYGRTEWVATQPPPHLCWEAIGFDVSQTQFRIDYNFYPSSSGDNITGLAGTSWNFKYYIFIDRGEP